MKEWETIAGMTSNNVSIMNKLDTLRYRLSAGTQEKLAIGSSEFVFSAEYKSLNMGRYRFSKADRYVDRSGEKIFILLPLIPENL